MPRRIFFASHFVMISHVYFKGTVQGVGFRYTCHNYAQGLGLNGTVRNLPDGRVELWAQGSSQSVDSLIERLKDHFGGYIHDIQRNDHKAQPEFFDFKIVV